MHRHTSTLATSGNKGDGPRSALLATSRYFWFSFLLKTGTDYSAMLTVFPACTWQGRIEFYARAGLHNVLAFSGQYSFQHRQETVATRRNRPHPVHQALEEPSVLVVIAIADAYSPSMPPDLGR